MNENNSGRKILSLVLLILGVVLLIAALWMDFTKTYLIVNMGSAKIALRGLFLVLGALLVLAGMYFIPIQRFRYLIRPSYCGRPVVVPTTTL